MELTSTGLIARVRAERAGVSRGEAAIFELAAAWADSHPDLGEEPYRADRDPEGEAAITPVEEYDDIEIPRIAWDAAAPFAAGNAMSTGAGRRLIRDALIVRHRLPRLWRRVVACEVPVWRARRVAAAVQGRPSDVAAALDEQLTPVADKVGQPTIDRLLDEAMLRLHAEERELEQLEALDERYATLHPGSINHTGIAEMTLRADWPDLDDFDRALSRVARALATGDSFADSFDVRRSRAIGILADPARALALLEGAPEPAHTRKMQVIIHLSDLALLGMDPVVRDATADRAILDQVARQWCGRTDRHLTITPVIDLAAHPDHLDQAGSTAYEIRGRLRTRVDVTNPHCVFPWCTRPARSCDCDHIVPYADGGPSCECNLAPLCRHHHRLKTHAGWSYTRVEPGTYLWSEPHRQQFLRDRHGTRDVTPSDRLISPATRAGPPA